MPQSLSPRGIAGVQSPSIIERHETDTHTHIDFPTFHDFPICGLPRAISQSCTHLPRLDTSANSLQVSQTNTHSIPFHIDQYPHKMMRKHEHHGRPHKQSRLYYVWEKNGKDLLAAALPSVKVKASLPGLVVVVLVVPRSAAPVLSILFCSFAMSAKATSQRSSDGIQVSQAPHGTTPIRSGPSKLTSPEKFGKPQ